MKHVLLVLLLIGSGCSRPDQPDRSEELLVLLVRETMAEVVSNRDTSSPPAVIATMIVDRHAVQIAAYVRLRIKSEPTPETIDKVRRELISGVVSAINDQRSGRLRGPSVTTSTPPARAVPVPTRSEVIEQVMRTISARPVAHSDSLRSVIGSILAEIGGNTPIDDRLWANSQLLAAEVVDRHRSDIEHYVLQVAKQGQESVEVMRKQLAKGVASSLDDLRDRRERVDRMAKTIDGSIPALAAKAATSNLDQQAATEQVMQTLRVQIEHLSVERSAYLRTMASFQGVTTSVDETIRDRDMRYLQTLRAAVDDEVAMVLTKRSDIPSP
jgi:hypothetical protein